MNDATKVWVLYGLLTVIGFVLIFLAKWFFNETLRILSEIREELKSLTHITTKQDIVIQNIKEDVTQMHERLNRHSNRIMDVEKNFITLSDKVKQ
jgi:dissimilatory sulfite reductase (desulfoviridin) alpha/beta subunit